MEIPGLVVELELPLQVYTTAMATPDLNPLNEARDRIHILMDTVSDS